ncbi:MAG: hypothetical protein ABIQ90_11370 [Polaromonas sp.]
MNYEFDPAKDESNLDNCLRTDAVRVISLRKANPREVNRYVAEN